MFREWFPTDFSPPPRSSWWFCPRVPVNRWKAKWVQVMLEDGTVLDAHWACDLSGDEQPPFLGWFDRQHREILFKRIMLWRKLVA